MNSGPTADWRRPRRDPSFFVLFGLGVFLLVLPFVSALHDFVELRIGQIRLLELVLGFGLIYLALIIRDINGIRRRNLVIMETLLTALRGGGVAPRPREAVDILIAALQANQPDAREAALRQLPRLTGQDLGTDAAAWQAWWAAHREDFQGRPAGSTEEPPNP